MSWGFKLFRYTTLIGEKTLAQNIYIYIYTFLTKRKVSPKTPAVGKVDYRLWLSTNRSDSLENFPIFFLKKGKVSLKTTAVGEVDYRL